MINVNEYKMFASISMVYVNESLMISYCTEKCADQSVPNLCFPFGFFSNLLKSEVHNNSTSNIKPSGMDLELAIGKHHGWKGITPCRD